MAAEIVSLNPAEGINGYMLSCVNRGLCDGLITRPEEPYRVSVCAWSKEPQYVVVENLNGEEIPNKKLQNWWRFM